MAGVFVPVVVDHVDRSSIVDLWGSTRCVVDVVALEGDLIIGAREVQRPVVVTWMS